jgi:hypothetical protein
MLSFLQWHSNDEMDKNPLKWQNKYTSGESVTERLSLWTADVEKVSENSRKRYRVGILS